MKARYHKFTGDIPVVFVQDAKKFITSLGVPMNETSDKVSPDFMHEVDISGVKMLVFSEGLLRTLYGARVTPIIESHLALWKGTQRHPDNTLAAYRYAMALAERFNRPKCHELLRRKLAETTKIELPSMKQNQEKKDSRPVENILFTESAKSDAYEVDVAKYLDSMPGVQANRPSVSTDFPDVLVGPEGGKLVYLEVKMNHTDNLANTRLAYRDGKWEPASVAKAPLAAKYLADAMNKSSSVKTWINRLKKFLGKKKIKLVSSSSAVKKLHSDPEYVTKEQLKEYIDASGYGDAYILDDKNVNLGSLVTQHYTKGKGSPAYYMQAGDDFFMIGSKNPLKLPGDIPKLSGSGNLRVRIGFRKSSSAYELQPEIKIVDMGSSPYSVKPGTKKKNPFEQFAKKSMK